MNIYFHFKISMETVKLFLFIKASKDQLEHSKHNWAITYRHSIVEIVNISLEYFIPFKMKDTDFLDLYLVTFTCKTIPLKNLTGAKGETLRLQSPFIILSEKDKQNPNYITFKGNSSGSDFFYSYICTFNYDLNIVKYKSLNEHILKSDSRLTQSISMLYTWYFYIKQDWVALKNYIDFLNEHEEESKFHPPSFQEFLERMLLHTLETPWEKAKESLSLVYGIQLIVKALPPILPSKFQFKELNKDKRIDFIQRISDYINSLIYINDSDKPLQEFLKGYSLVLSIFSLNEETFYYFEDLYKPCLDLPLNCHFYLWYLKYFYNLYSDKKNLDVILEKLIQRKGLSLKISCEKERLLKSIEKLIKLSSPNFSLSTMSIVFLLLFYRQMFINDLVSNDFKILIDKIANTEFEKRLLILLKTFKNEFFQTQEVNYPQIKAKQGIFKKEKQFEDKKYYIFENEIVKINLTLENESKSQKFNNLIDLLNANKSLKKKELNNKLEKLNLFNCPIDFQKGIALIIYFTLFSENNTIQDNLEIKSMRELLNKTYEANTALKHKKYLLDKISQEIIKRKIEENSESFLINVLYSPNDPLIISTFNINTDPKTLDCTQLLLMRIDFFKEILNKLLRLIPLKLLIKNLNSIKPFFSAEFIDKFISFDNIPELIKEEYNLIKALNYLFDLDIQIIHFSEKYQCNLTKFPETLPKERPIFILLAKDNKFIELSYKKNSLVSKIECTNFIPEDLYLVKIKRQLSDLTFPLFFRFIKDFEVPINLPKHVLTSLYNLIQAKFSSSLKIQKELTNSMIDIYFILDEINKVKEELIKTHLLKELKNFIIKKLLSMPKINESLRKSLEAHMDYLNIDYKEREKILMKLNIDEYPDQANILRGYETTNFISYYIREENLSSSDSLFYSINDKLFTRKSLAEKILSHLRNDKDLQDLMKTEFAHYIFSNSFQHHFQEEIKLIFKHYNPGNTLKLVDQFNEILNEKTCSHLKDAIDISPNISKVLTKRKRKMTKIGSTKIDQKRLSEIKKEIINYIKENCNEEILSNFVRICIITNRRALPSRIDEFDRHEKLHFKKLLDRYFGYFNLNVEIYVKATESSNIIEKYLNVGNINLKSKIYILVSQKDNYNSYSRLYPTNKTKLLDTNIKTGIELFTKYATEECLKENLEYKQSLSEFEKIRRKVTSALDFQDLTFILDEKIKYSLFKSFANLSENGDQFHSNFVQFKNILLQKLVSIVLGLKLPKNILFENNKLILLEDRDLISNKINASLKELANLEFIGSLNLTKIKLEEQNNHAAMKWSEFLFDMLFDSLSSYNLLKEYLSDSQESEIIKLIQQTITDIKNDESLMSVFEKIWKIFQKINPYLKVNDIEPLLKNYVSGSINSNNEDKDLKVLKEFFNRNFQKPEKRNANGKKEDIYEGENIILSLLEKNMEDADLVIQAKNILYCDCDINLHGKSINIMANQIK